GQVGAAPGQDGRHRHHPGQSEQSEAGGQSPPAPDHGFRRRRSRDPPAMSDRPQATHRSAWPPVLGSVRSDVRGAGTSSGGRASVAGRTTVSSTLTTAVSVPVTSLPIGSLPLTVPMFVILPGLDSVVVQEYFHVSPGSSSESPSVSPPGVEVTGPHLSSVTETSDSGAFPGLVTV